MYNLYSITTNQAAIINLVRVINRHVGDLPPMPGVFTHYAWPRSKPALTSCELLLINLTIKPFVDRSAENDAPRA